MVTVEIDPVVIEQRLGSGGLACPGSAGRLAGWGRARTDLFAAIRSVIATGARNDRDPFAAVDAALSGNPILSPG